VWSIGTGGYAGYELLAEGTDCILCGECDVAVGGTHRGIGLGVDEHECFEAGRTEFETGFPVLASRNHGARERMRGGAIPGEIRISCEGGVGGGWRTKL